jgi:heme exporter protein A
VNSATRLTVSNLAIIRSERLLFRDLSIQLDAGDTLVVSGTNGAGKSSLLRAIAGLLAPAAGTISLMPNDEDMPVGQRLHFVGVRDPLKAVETVGETLVAWCELFDGRVHDADPAFDDPVHHTLTDWNLAALRDVPCGALSSGQRRRTSLARLSLTTAGQRPLWLLDEPGNALDVASLALLRRTIALHRHAGGMVIVATHQDLALPDVRLLDLDAPIARQAA